MSELTRVSRFGELDHLQLAEGRVAPVADHDVVEDLDPNQLENLTRMHEGCGQAAD